MSKHLFISYGRRESLNLVARLHQKLKLAGYDAWFDKVNIPDGEDYAARINNGIESAHNFVYVMAPRSLCSPYCLIELEYARVLGKRVIPVNQMVIFQVPGGDRALSEGDKQVLHGFYAFYGIEDPNIETVQQVLDRSLAVVGRTDWLDGKETLSDEDCAALGEWAQAYENQWHKHDDVEFLRGVELPQFGHAVDDLDGVVERIQTVLERHRDYVEQHTEILAQTLEWQTNQRANRYLLVGKEREAAENWLLHVFRDGEQAPCVANDLVCDFICESRKNGENRMTDCFICYAREDLDIRDKVVHSLSRFAITTWRHDSDIVRSTESWQAIEQGIEEADNVLFFLSPDAVRSESCLQELQHALRYHKRLIPLLIVPTEADDFPAALKNLQHIDFTDNQSQQDYDRDIADILNILRQDEAYYSFHKRLLCSALKWQRSGQKASFLLRGHNLDNAQTWLRLNQQRPQHAPTDAHRELIAVSEANKGRLSTEVFLSYSRKDGDFTRKLNTALQDAGKTVWFDQESIASGVDFEAELYKGINAADNFVFLVSPDSVTSPYCEAEVVHAEKQGKRILTVLTRETDPALLPEALRTINWIDFSQLTEFDKRFAELIQAIELDRVHVQQHTVFQQRALEWQDNDKSEDFLLNRSACEKAETWRAAAQGKSPPPTKLQHGYIDTSRAVIKAAEVEREHKQRRAFTVVMAGMIVSVALALFALMQMNNAEHNLTTAQKNLLHVKAKEFSSKDPTLAMRFAERAAWLDPHDISVNRTLAQLVATAQYFAGPRMVSDVEGEFSALAASHDSQWLATAQTDYGTPEIRVWDTEQAQMTLSIGNTLKMWAYEGETKTLVSEYPLAERVEQPKKKLEIFINRFLAQEATSGNQQQNFQLFEWLPAAEAKPVLVEKSRMESTLQRYFRPDAQDERTAENAPTALEEITAGAENHAMPEDTAGDASGGAEYADPYGSVGEATQAIDQTLRLAFRPGMHTWLLQQNILHTYLWHWTDTSMTLYTLPAMSDFAFSGGGNYLLGQTEVGLYLWDFSTEQARLVDIGARATSLAAAPSVAYEGLSSPALFVLQDDAGYVRLLNASGESVALPGQPSLADATLRFSPDGKELLIFGAGNTVYHWQILTRFPEVLTYEQCKPNNGDNCRALAAGLEDDALTPFVIFNDGNALYWRSTRSAPEKKVAFRPSPANYDVPVHVAFRPYAREHTVLSYGNQLIRQNLQTLRDDYRLPNSHGLVYSDNPSPDALLMLDNDQIAVAANNTVRFWFFKDSFKTKTAVVRQDPRIGKLHPVDAVFAEILDFQTLLERLDEPDIAQHINEIIGFYEFKIKDIECKLQEKERLIQSIRSSADGESAEFDGAGAEMGNCKPAEIEQAQQIMQMFADTGAVDNEITYFKGAKLRYMRELKVLQSRFQDAPSKLELIAAIDDFEEQQAKTRQDTKTTVAANMMNRQHIMQKIQKVALFILGSLCFAVIAFPTLSRHHLFIQEHRYAAYLTYWGITLMVICVWWSILLLAQKEFVADNRYAELMSIFYLLTLSAFTPSLLWQLYRLQAFPRLRKIGLSLAAMPLFALTLYFLLDGSTLEDSLGWLLIIALACTIPLELSAFILLPAKRWVALMRISKLPAGGYLLIALFGSALILPWELDMRLAYLTGQAYWLSILLAMAALPFLLLRIQQQFKRYHRYGRYVVMPLMLIAYSAFLLALIVPDGNDVLLAFLDIDRAVFLDDEIPATMSLLLALIAFPFSVLDGFRAFRRKAYFYSGASWLASLFIATMLLIYLPVYYALLAALLVFWGGIFGLLHWLFGQRDNIWHSVQQRLRHWQHRSTTANAVAGS